MAQSQPQSQPQSPWLPLAGMDRRRLSEARLMAHYAAQWLARSARAYVSAKPDDSHTNLGWDDAFNGFNTHPLLDGARLGLRLRDLTLTIATPQGMEQSFALDGRRETDVRAWLGGLVSAKGLDARALDAPSPYEMPAFAVATGSPYAADGEALGALAAWYTNANTALEEARRALAARGPAAPAVRCWPHHFDLDSLVYFSAGKDARSMGLGFSPGDDYYDEPYFYVSLHPAPAVAFAPLPSIAHWHTHHFTAAVAPASRILAAADQRGETRSYLASAIDFAIKALGPGGRKVTSDIAG